MDPVLSCDGWRCGALEYTSSFVLHTLQLSDSSSPLCPTPPCLELWSAGAFWGWASETWLLSVMSGPDPSKKKEKTCQQSEEEELRRKPLNSIFIGYSPKEISNQIWAYFASSISDEVEFDVWQITKTTDCNWQRWRLRSLECPSVIVRKK